MKKNIIYKTEASSIKYWNFCYDNNVPYIEISPIEEGYSKVNCSCLMITDYAKLDQTFLNNIKSFYDAYLRFFMIPKDNWAISEDPVDLAFLVKDEHAKFIASHLFDYVTLFLKEKLLHEKL